MEKAQKRRAMVSDTVDSMTRMCIVGSVCKWCSTIWYGNGEERRKRRGLRREKKGIEKRKTKEKQ